MIKHSEEFRQETVRIALTSGLSRERVALDLGIGKSTLSKWLSQYRPSDLVSAPQADLARDNERLRLENRVLKEGEAAQLIRGISENRTDILKKATQFFAKERSAHDPGDHGKQAHEIRVYRCLAAPMARGDPLPGHARQRTWLSILADTINQHACAD
jgi:transposase